MHGEADAAGTLRDQGALFERVVYSLYAVIRHCQKEATKKAITPLNSSSMCLQRVDFWVCSAHCLLVVLPAFFTPLVGANVLVPFNCELRSHSL